jgi:hypothetical protein
MGIVFKQGIHLTKSRVEEGEEHQAWNSLDMELGQQVVRLIRQTGQPGLVSVSDSKQANDDGSVTLRMAVDVDFPKAEPCPPI